MESLNLVSVCRALKQAGISAKAVRSKDIQQYDDEVQIIGSRVSVQISSLYGPTNLVVNRYEGQGKNLAIRHWPETRSLKKMVAQVVQAL
jgi:hypothetical protein